MSKIVIEQKTKKIWHHNPISGHRWSEDVPIKGYEVWGGGFFHTSHATLEKAEKERDIRISLNKNFPRTRLYSVREWRKCKRLGLNLPGKLKDAYDF